MPVTSGHWRALLRRTPDTGGAQPNFVALLTPSPICNYTVDILMSLVIRRVRKIAKSEY